MNNRHLRRLAKEGKPVSFSAGEVIVKKGAEGVGFYLVLKGRAQAKKGSRVLKEFEKGQFFGEMALLDNGPRSADVVASEPTDCFGLTHWDFEGIRHEDPEMTEAILRELARRLRETDELL
jgi:CRP-like cAMP-binding protein